jgi:hypothetical protein
MNKEVWKLSDEKYEFIKGEVVHIFEMYEIRCIPVSGFEIAIKMGITLIPYSGLSRKKLKAARTISEDGFFCENGGKEIIYYNDMDYKYDRQNFTILHEIGHYGIEYHIVKTYPNGVRVGNVPNHRNPRKRKGTGQAWFPRNWTSRDIRHAGEHVANLRGNRHSKNGEAVYGIWKGVRVGVIRTNGKIATIFPDSKQPYRKGKK